MPGREYTLFVVRPSVAMTWLLVLLACSAREVPLGTAAGADGDTDVDADSDTDSDTDTDSNEADGGGETGGGLGDPCDDANDCTDLDAPICVRDLEFDMGPTSVCAPVEGGACTTACDESPCPSDGVCSTIVLTMEGVETPRLCFPPCDSEADCREAWSCSDVLTAPENTCRPPAGMCGE